MLDNFRAHPGVVPFYNAERIQQILFQQRFLAVQHPGAAGLINTLQRLQVIELHKSRSAYSAAGAAAPAAGAAR